MKLRSALRRAGLDTAAAAARLIVICLGVGAGYDLADRLLTRLTIAVVLITAAALLTLGAGWWVTLRTGDDLTRLQNRHEDDQYSIAQLQHRARRLDRDLRQQRGMSDHLIQELVRRGIEVTLPPPRTGSFSAVSTEVLDEQPTGGER